jgi:hypothetical protein
MKRIAVVVALAAFFVVAANAQQADAPPATSSVRQPAQPIPRDANAKRSANIDIQVGARGKWVEVQVSRLKANGHTRVKVQLKDHQSVDGVLIQIEKESFVLKDKNTGKEKEIAYADVAKLEAPAHSLGVKIARQTFFVAIAPVVAVPILIRDLCE